MDYVTERAYKIYFLAESDEGPNAQNILLYRLYALLSYVKGQMTLPSDVHDAYVVWQLATFAEPRYLVPFSELPPEIQELDDQYVEAIHRSCDA